MKAAYSRAASSRTCDPDPCAVRTSHRLQCCIEHSKTSLLMRCGRRESVAQINTRLPSVSADRSCAIRERMWLGGGVCAFAGHERREGLIVWKLFFQTPFPFFAISIIRYTTLAMRVVAAAASLLVGSTAASTLTPPVLPLIVRNPYLSTWLVSRCKNPSTSYKSD